MKYLKIYSFRKVGALNTPYYIVDYDFPKKSKLRNAFYRERKGLLPGKLENHTRSMSVIELDDFETAKKLFKLAIKYGAIAVNLRTASTIDQHPMK